MKKMSSFQLQKVISERDECRMRLGELEGALQLIANYITTEEADTKLTSETFGLGVNEVIEMAHDEMIYIARGVLVKIVN